MGVLVPYLVLQVYMFTCTSGTSAIDALRQGLVDLHSACEHISTTFQVLHLLSYTCDDLQFLAYHIVYIYPCIGSI